MPSSVKTLGSNAQILTKKGLIRGGRGLAGMIKTGLESANPFLGRMGNGLIGGLTNIANPGGIGGGSGSIFGKLGRLGRTGSSTSSVISKAGSGKKWALIGILGFILLLGVVSLPSSSSTTPSPSSPPTTSTDISNCLFTRGAENPSAVKFQSSSLLSYIQEAANKSTIPPAVLAAFVRVESPSSSGMSDEQITAYTCIYSGPGKNVSETGALGIMQIQPPGTTSLIGDPASCDDCIDAGARLIGKTLSTMTEADYCNPRTGIIVGAGWILKKMSYLGLGDGTKWDPAWTNDTKAITALVNTYYGDILYPDVNTGPYNYATDVQTSIQNCQVSAPGNVPPPPTDGNYQKWLEEFGVKIASGFVPEVYQWAYEALAPTASVAPKFQGLLDLPANPVEVIPICNHVSYTSGRTIYLRNRTAFCITVVAGTPEGPTSNPDLFRHTLTHELGHVLYNTDRTTYNAKIIQARINDNGFLTAYSQNAASSEFLACGAGDDNGNRADEDFAESVSYFINRGIVTQDYGCGIWSEELGVNPYDLQINDQMKYAAHYQFMTELLK